MPQRSACASTVVVEALDKVRKSARPPHLPLSSVCTQDFLSASMRRAGTAWVTTHCRIAGRRLRGNGAQEGNQTFTAPHPVAFAPTHPLLAGETFTCYTGTAWKCVCRNRTAKHRPGKLSMINYESSHQHCIQHLPSTPRMSEAWHLECHWPSGSRI